MAEPDPAQRDDPVESGPLENEPEAGAERPPTTDEPAEGGAVEPDTGSGDAA